MLIKELIEQLNKYDGNLEVYVCRGMKDLPMNTLYYKDSYDVDDRFVPARVLLLNQ